MRRLVLVTVLLAVTAAACGGSSELTMKDDGSSVSLKPGEQIVVALEENGTTGFTWELAEFDAAVIEPVGDSTFEADNPDLVGSGGTRTWTLRAVSPGVSRVRFVSSRPWEDKPPAEVFTFTANVAP